MRATTRIGVDVGGTFTDLVLHDDTRCLTQTHKRLTTPEAPCCAIIEGIRQLLRQTRTPIGHVRDIVHGTTLITNTLLERTGARVGLITTEGFSDILEMGHEIRYDVEDLHARPAPVIVPRHLRCGVTGRITADGAEHTPLDEEGVLNAARGLVDEAGIEALAIAFLHSYANPSHERCARDLVHGLYPDLPITLSADVAPEIREYERTNTACVNAYVQPAISAYLDRLEHDLTELGFTGRLSMMLSSGGLTTLDQAKAFPVRLLESGPAAGAIAAAFVATRAMEPRVISFDMGGTTAKICLIEDGQPRLKHEFEAGRTEKFTPGSGLPLKLTVIDMIEIGSGGGSIATVDGLGLMKVGPHSAGSVPGPVAYNRGGTQPTVTDSDLLLGYLDPDHFLGGNMNLSLPKVRRSIEQLGTRLGIDAATVAAGIQDIVTESMAAATRMHLAEKGHDPRTYTLITFGGAGPVHAYALAKRLKVPRIIVPPSAGLMSAFGLLAAAPSVDDVRGYPSTLASVDWEHVASLYQEMESRARSLLQSPRDSDGDVMMRRSADMRHIGQGFEITVPIPDGDLSTMYEAKIRETFSRAYHAVFGRTIHEAAAEVINWRLTASLSASPPTMAHRQSDGLTRPQGQRSVHVIGYGPLVAEVHDRYTLLPGARIRGPAVFVEDETSCSVGPDSTVTVDAQHNLIIDIDTMEAPR